MTWGLERYDRDCTRIVDQDGKVAALIGALCNGRWVVSDCHDNQLSKRSFSTVKDAFAFWKSLPPPPVEIEE